MATAGQPSLTTGHKKATDKDTAKGVSQQRVAYLFPEEQAALLKSIPVHIIKKAWFLHAHLLLNSGAVIVDVGCEDGTMAYALSILKPDCQIIGLDLDKKQIEKAQKKYVRDNLSFQAGNAYENDIPKNSCDAIINSFLLYELYASSHYNENVIKKTLQKQYASLKDNGLLVLRDYHMPPHGEFVLMELKDIASKSQRLQDLSEPDLLIWFSENARSGTLHHDNAGFFLEELPARYPNTRMFRLPTKWAHEFILRKDDRTKLEQELKKEYAFITEHDLKREFRYLGARVLYTAPHWDSGFIRSRYERKVWLYREDGTPIGPPPTSNILIAQKIANKKSQILQERRTSRSKSGQLHLSAVRNEKTGAVSDIVTRHMEIAEIIPYRITEDNRLKIYLHEGIPRGLVNAVQRNGKNLDGKRWSGHLVEAMSMESHNIRNIQNGNSADLHRFSRNSLGIRPSLDATLQNGPGFYPDPYRIDERIETFYLRTEESLQPFKPKHLMEDVSGFSTHGRIREYDAQDIMNALAVGFLPASHLETQIMALYEMLNMKFVTWSDMPLQLSEIPVEEVAGIRNFTQRTTTVDDRFKPTRGSAGTIRVVQSVFVDEGRDEDGGVTGLAARDVEFVVPEDATLNTAVVMPLVKDLNGEVLAGVTTEYLPVPQRYKGSGLSMSVPSFSLPKEVNDMFAARRYVAEKFKVDPKFVAPMGESYFTHIGMTPHRIYPFVVTNIRPAGTFVTNGITQFTTIKKLWKLCYWDNGVSFMRLVSRVYKNFCQDSDLSVNWSFEQSLSADLGKPVMTDASTLASSAPPAHTENKASSSSDSHSDGSGDTKGKTGTSGFTGPNDDVMGNDFKDRNGQGVIPLTRQPR